jgi:hypothetical protein
MKTTVEIMKTTGPTALRRMSLTVRNRMKMNVGMKMKMTQRKPKKRNKTGSL